LEEKYNLFREKRRNQGRSKEYKADISYAYPIGERDYIAKTYEIKFVGLKSNLVGSQPYLEDTIKVYQKCKAGALVKVYCDPDDPSSALLEKGYKSYVPTYLIFGLIAIAYGIYGTIKNY